MSDNEDTNPEQQASNPFDLGPIFDSVREWVTSDRPAEVISQMEKEIDEMTLQSVVDYTMEDYFGVENFTDQVSNINLSEIDFQRFDLGNLLDTIRTNMFETITDADTTIDNAPDPEAIRPFVGLDDLDSPGDHVTPLNSCMTLTGDINDHQECEQQQEAQKVVVKSEVTL